MTSMLLTERRGLTAPASSLLAAVTRSDSLLLRVGGRGLLDQRADHGLVRWDPVGDQLPLLPVPLLELHRAAPLVVHAGGLERLEEVVRAQVPDPFLVEVQILQSPADFLPGQRPLSELGLRGADRLGVQDPVDDAAVVV